MNSFLQQISDDIDIDLTSTTLSSWTEYNRTIKGHNWSWHNITNDFRFLKQVYQDKSQVMVFKKARQTGISEYLVNKLHFLIDVNPHTTGLHCLPNLEQARKFSNARISPLYSPDESPKIFAKLKNPEWELKAASAASNVFHRQFINWSNLIISFIGGEGTKSTDARSVSADFVCLDEAKDLPQDKMIDVIECMSASPHKILTIAGTPDFPDTEFDRWFEESDQHAWISTCPTCHDAQELTIDTIKSIQTAPSTYTFPPTQKYYYACRTCGAELDRTINSCQWIPQNPDGAHRGYKMPQLICPWISADEILEKKSRYRSYPWKFMNEVLAETFTGGSKPISLAKLLEGKISPDDWTGTKVRYISIGVDWGNQSHYTILGANNINEIFLLDYGILKDPVVIKHAHELAAIAKAWDPQYIIADSGYGKAQNQILFREFPHVAYSVFYKNSAFNPIFELIDKEGADYLSPSDYQYHIQINHTSMCDMFLSTIQENRFKFKLDEEDDLIPGVSDMRDFLDGIIASKTSISEQGGIPKKKWVITKAHQFASTSLAIIGIEQLFKEDPNTNNGAINYFTPH